MSRLFLCCLVWLHHAVAVHGSFGFRQSILLPGPTDRANVKRLWNNPPDNGRDQLHPSSTLSVQGGGLCSLASKPPSQTRDKAWEEGHSLQVARCLLLASWIISAFLCSGCGIVSLGTHGLVHLVGNKPLLLLMQLVVLVHYGRSAAQAVAQTLHANTRYNLYPKDLLAFFRGPAAWVWLVSIVGTLLVFVWDTLLWMMRLSSNIGRLYIEAALGICKLGCILGWSTLIGIKLASSEPDVDCESHSLTKTTVLSLLGGGCAILLTIPDSIVPSTNWFKFLFKCSGYLCIGSSLGSVLLELVFRSRSRKIEAVPHKEIDLHRSVCAQIVE
jgi:hypothetical protein